DYHRTLKSLARLTLPQIADYCLLFESGPEETLELVALAHVDPAKEALLTRLDEVHRESELNPVSLVGQVVETGEALLLATSSPPLAEAITGDPQLSAVFAPVDPRSIMILPLSARGQRLGALLLATSADSGRTYGEEDFLLAKELARRAALAIDNARLFGEAEAANLAKDHFLAVLSHELRTPLTPALMTLVRLLEAPHLPEDLRGDLERVRRNIELESKLLDDLLDLTRIARGQLELSRELTDVHPLLQHAVEVFCASQIQNKRLDCKTELTANEHQVWGDPVRLQQILWNLLQNAIKFTPEGGRITARTWNDEPGTLSIGIVDSGVGIEPDALPRLFGVFDTSGRSTQRRIGGLGLGLAVCRALVELHGGTIHAASEGRGRGASFTVTLPTTLPTGDIAAPPLPAEEMPPGRSLRILLVEDHEDTLHVMARFLAAARHQVREAESVTSALAAARSETFDLVVSDLGLPDGSGLDLMRQLRELYGLKGIAVSGYGTPQDIEHSLSAGFVEHLIKPVYPQKLKEAIARASGLGRRI
ncbi:MAG TPA: ATP-binding protein, partial [Thermoanaerobaculia bacterium]|nr:ATP-binding protein [Thermoanaerobaculia bacterium]